MGFGNPLFIAYILALGWQPGKTIKSGMNIESRIEDKHMSHMCGRVGIG